MVLAFVTFLNFFYFVKFVCGEMLATRLKKVTNFNSLDLGFFMSVLHAFCRLNSLLLTFITEVCSEIPCSVVLCFAKTKYLNFIAIQLTGFHMMQDLGVGILGTNY